MYIPRECRAESGTVPGGLLVSRVRMFGENGPNHSAHSAPDHEPEFTRTLRKKGKIREVFATVSMLYLFYQCTGSSFSVKSEPHSRKDNNVWQTSSTGSRFP